MTTARDLRERARARPTAVTSESDDIANHLETGDQTAQQHAVEAAKKVAYVAPDEMRGCVEPLYEVARTHDSPTVVEGAKKALEYIARSHTEAEQALTSLERGVPYRPSPPSQDPSSSPSGTTDTDVFDREVENSGDTEVYDDQERTVNYCPDCGEDVRNRPSPNFCPSCGVVLRTDTVCRSCGSETEPSDEFCITCGTSLD